MDLIHDEIVECIERRFPGWVDKERSRNYPVKPAELERRYVGNIILFEPEMDENDLSKTCAELFSERVGEYFSKLRMMREYLETLDFEPVLIPVIKEGGTGGSPNLERLVYKIKVSEREMREKGRFVARSDTYDIVNIGYIPHC